jgi:hypothetical protein
MTSSSTDTNDVVAPFTIDLATGDVHWSPPIYHLYGLCPDADRPTVEALLAGIVPEDRGRAREEFAAGIRDGGSFSIRYRLPGPDGKRHEIHLAAVGSRLNGVTTYVSGFLIDVTVPMSARLNAAVEASAAHRATIEQAKGAIMLGYTVTEQEAFAVLRLCSNQYNVRLSVLAERIVQALDNGARGDLATQQAVVSVLADLAEAVKRDRAAAAPAPALAPQVGDRVRGERSAPLRPA